jgi:hypothetical protein
VRNRQKKAASDLGELLAAGGNAAQANVQEDCTKELRSRQPSKRQVESIPTTVRLTASDRARLHDLARRFGRFHRNGMPVLSLAMRSALRLGMARLEEV